MDKLRLEVEYDLCTIALLSSQYFSIRADAKMCLGQKAVNIVPRYNL